MWRNIMFNIGRPAAVACLSALCLCLFVGGCSKDADNLAAEADQDAKDASEFAISVKVAPVVRLGIKSTIHTVGTVEAVNQAKISAKIPGKVERIMAEEGDRVEAGQALLCIEKTELTLTVRQAEAALSMAGANYSKAETEWVRARELFETGISSQQQRDLAKSTFEVAQASVKQAKADLGLAEHQLDNADVTTLFGGTVTHRYVDPGERVNPGQPLFEVAEIDSVEIEIGVSDRRFSDLALGQPVTLAVDGYPGHVFEGKVKNIHKVTVGLANPGELLKPGMFARAEIQTGYHADALVMPRAASLEEEGKYFAVAVRDGKACRAEISLGFRDGESIEVLSGLEEGDRVVLEGAYALARGRLRARRGRKGAGVRRGM
jgi:RND family efflux transporter MFP subunit